MVPLSEAAQALGSLVQSPTLRGCPLGLSGVLGSKKVFPEVWGGKGLKFSVSPSSLFCSLPGGPDCPSLAAAGLGQLGRGEDVRVPAHMPSVSLLAGTSQLWPPAEAPAQPIMGY